MTRVRFHTGPTALCTSEQLPDLAQNIDFPAIRYFVKVKIEKELSGVRSSSVNVHCHTPWPDRSKSGSYGPGDH